ncbi:hypothetical protein B0T26DRAFT_218979 [Lasiosphaeria miniovina]|uniref:Uncharacterized protein n=1 Tax=Lasiosphaeria miniovina TaxID=1954250 RepID=A0AA40AUX9_9PEZI|nr:uncharacterized protein B0T26DRAFT_218979 [Lasiosphaeria miniovina]KAK0722438.1 hypothetical protein B0T26DRAFT_218979 [Lasiosphaeria miniovina]
MLSRTPVTRTKQTSHLGVGSNPSRQGRWRLTAFLSYSWTQTGIFGRLSLAIGENSLSATDSAGSRGHPSPQWVFSLGVWVSGAHAWPGLVGRIDRGSENSVSQPNVTVTHPTFLFFPRLWGLAFPGGNLPPSPRPHTTSHLRPGQEAPKIRGVSILPLAGQA